MTAARFKQIQNGAMPKDQQELLDYNNTLEWQARSEAAKKAVVTKRKKYKQWPCNRKRTIDDDYSI